MRLRPSTVLPAPLLALAVAHVVNAAPADAPRGVELVVDESCSRVDRTSLGHLLDIEQRRDAEHEVQQARVSVSCEHEVLTLQVEARGGGALPRQRSFAESDVAGEVGARVLSLAAIELLPTPAPAVADAPSQRPPPPPPPPLTEAPRRSRARRPAPSARLMALGTVRTFRLERPLLGGGLSVDYLRAAPLALRLEFDVTLADHSSEWGSTHTQLTTISAQAGYLALHDAWSARALVGYRFGSGRITGESAQGSRVEVGTVAGASGGPLLSTGFGLRSGNWMAELSAEGGLVSFPLEGRVTGHDSVALRGYWLGLSLNVGALL